MTTLPSFLAPSIRICPRSGPSRLAISATVAAMAGPATSTGRHTARTAQATRALHDASVTIDVMAFPQPLSGRPRKLSLGDVHRLDPAARPIGYRHMAVDDLDAGERVVVHAHELADLAGIVDRRQRGRERNRVGIEEPRPDMGAEPEAHVAGLADARRGERVAQATELGQLQADGIDDAVRD